MNKKLISILLALALMFSTMTATAQTATDYRMKNILEQLNGVTSRDIKTALDKFSDAGNHWAKDSIGQLTHLGIIGGYPDGTFKPSQNIQVDEFIKLTVTAMGYKPGMGNGYWAEPVIEIAKDEKLIGENEFTNYRRPITRQEMAKIITNAVLTKEEAPDSNYLAYMRSFIKDYGKTTDQYKNHVLTAYGMGLIGGYPDKEFKGLNNSTRAEASVVIMRFLKDSMRIKIKIDERDKINLINNLTGEMTTVYPPSCNPEVIRIANALKVGVGKSKGFAGMMYSGFSGSIFVNLHETEEYQYSENPNDFHGSIIIPTIDDRRVQLVPYSITIDNVDQVRRLHNEVIHEIFNVLFEGDSAKVITEYEEQLNHVNENKNGSKIVVFNDRSIHFLVDGGGLSVGISVKGFRFK